MGASPYGDDKSVYFFTGALAFWQDTNKKYLQSWRFLVIYKIAMRYCQYPLPDWNDLIYLIFGSSKINKGTQPVLLVIILFLSSLSTLLQRSGKHYKDVAHGRGQVHVLWPSLAHTHPSGEVQHTQLPYVCKKTYRTLLMKQYAFIANLWYYSLSIYTTVSYTAFQLCICLHSMPNPIREIVEQYTYGKYYCRCSRCTISIQYIGYNTSVFALNRSVTVLCTT